MFVLTLFLISFITNGKNISNIIMETSDRIHKIHPWVQMIRTQYIQQPSSIPTVNPTSSPSSIPTAYPSIFPTTVPTLFPSKQPTLQPMKQPTNQPTKQPWQRRPTKQPLIQPSTQPSRQPFRKPSMQPKDFPTSQPTIQPRRKPSRQPSRNPSIIPTTQPQCAPSAQPTYVPFQHPSVQPFKIPTSQPTFQPNKKSPTQQPSKQPSGQPKKSPSKTPSQQPTKQPIRLPTRQPIRQPSRQPTSLPSRPSSQPTSQPSKRPTSQPFTKPTRQPTKQPLRIPTTKPSHQPTQQPTKSPTKIPSCKPTCQPSRPSSQPTVVPSNFPTYKPSSQPLCPPSRHPSKQPLIAPSSQPSIVPSIIPSRSPNVFPSRQPSLVPSERPSSIPTNKYKPTGRPTGRPSSRPSHPSSQPSVTPTLFPSNKPTKQPVCKPTVFPSTSPFSVPTLSPSQLPKSRPSCQPSRMPAMKPSSIPSQQPFFKNPSRRPSSQPSRQPQIHPTLQPSHNPTRQPSVHPFRLPSTQPTLQPLRRPSGQPTQQPLQRRPSRQPSRCPTKQPIVCHPSRQPSRQPLKQPSQQPSRRPSSQPIRIPTMQPSLQPHTRPSALPSSLPSVQPTQFPSLCPTSQPSHLPSSAPSSQPSSIPTHHPTFQPAQHPTMQPYSSPTVTPTSQPGCPTPSSQPTKLPSHLPTHQPSVFPSLQPSSSPTYQPYSIPTRIPIRYPTLSPTTLPTAQPFRFPSIKPTLQPFMNPSLQPVSTPSRIPSQQPSRQPSKQPNLRYPSRQPSVNPICRPTAQPIRIRPSMQPVRKPSQQPSRQPNKSPTRQPNNHPTKQPTSYPTRVPSKQPSRHPSRQPTRQPFQVPTRQPVGTPSKKPSEIPTNQPKQKPTRTPSLQPKRFPSSAPSIIPSSCPTNEPSDLPSEYPTIPPSLTPTFQPSMNPSSQPIIYPSDQPLQKPSTVPSSIPSKQPSSQPSLHPFRFPSSLPSTFPSKVPTIVPSIQPVNVPSRSPYSRPSKQPIRLPSRQPSNIPLLKPSVQPTRQPGISPTSAPSRQPLLRPSRQPRDHPTKQPFKFPTAQPSKSPHSKPVSRPTITPTLRPSELPTEFPSLRPSAQPYFHPSSFPSLPPSSIPTLIPRHEPSSNPSCQPMRVPSVPPSRQPFFKPSVRPSSQPVQHPSSQPSRQPIRKPSQQPLKIPSRQPSRQPIKCPTGQPSRSPVRRPSTQPARKPSRQPSKQPLSKPSTLPSTYPSLQPNCIYPTLQPQRRPTLLPFAFPTAQPTLIPTKHPSSYPSVSPSFTPTRQPSAQPSIIPICRPSSQPSLIPSSQPIHQPSVQPSVFPSKQPILPPTVTPTSQPADSPTSQPNVLFPSAQPIVHMPSSQPSIQPKVRPSQTPSAQPIRKFPTSQPSCQPRNRPSQQPNLCPSRQPSSKPHRSPSVQPSVRPSHAPSKQPTITPANLPTSQPAILPSIQPSIQPVMLPSHCPSQQPSKQPSRHPSRQPLRSPSQQPHNKPSSIPSLQPVRKPSGRPTHQPLVFFPTCQPTFQPSKQPVCCHPSFQPFKKPSSIPSKQPSKVPLGNPTQQPNYCPTNRPTYLPTTFPTLQPVIKPSLFPTTQPSSDPTAQPLRFPSTQPSMQPQRRPSKVPSTQPTSQPTRKPSIQPSQIPTEQPSAQPSKAPTNQPLKNPSMQPFNIPTMRPTHQPVNKPTIEPTQQPTCIPTLQPVHFPSSAPTCQPFEYPTVQPSEQPSCLPSQQPTELPSSYPSITPTFQPTSIPSLQPFLIPSRNPTSQPNPVPSVQPSNQPIHNYPSMQPSKMPSCQPTFQPIRNPSEQPRRHPSSNPSRQPIRKPSSQPKSKPSCQPTVQPYSHPSRQPLLRPSSEPSQPPSQHPTVIPSFNPSILPSHIPSLSPTSMPSKQPRRSPTGQPIKCPSRQPTKQPFRLPSPQPSMQPKVSPSKQPSIVPSSQPHLLPTIFPTTQPSSLPSSPTSQPSSAPSCYPTAQPGLEPSQQPSQQPSHTPSLTPTVHPSKQPTGKPTKQPSIKPTRQPQVLPSTQPVHVPTVEPSRNPSGSPSITPTFIPSWTPSQQPSSAPSKQPSFHPSRQPIYNPSQQPHSNPSAQPFRRPSLQPSSQPSCQPKHHPTLQPTIQPTSQPSVKPTSSRPTSAPTASPTCYPKSSRPTLMGETNNPSRYSTSHPTYDIHNLLHSKYYKDYSSNNSYFNSLPNTLTFSTFYYKGLTINGTCGEWNAFTNINAAIPLENIRYTGVTGYFDIYDFNLKFRKTTLVSCPLEGIMKMFMASLNSDASFQYYCNGYTWRIFTCLGSKVVCVNCKEVCVKTVTCPGTSFVINPCTTCRYDYSAGSVLNIQYTFDALYPQYIQPPAVSNVSSTSVYVDALLNKVGQLKCAAYLSSQRLVTSTAKIQAAGVAVNPFRVNGSVSEYQLELTGLIPSSNYTLYCITDDLSNHVMGLNDVIKYAISFETSCCKGFVFGEFPSIIQLSDTSATQYSFSLIATPAYILYVQLKFSIETCPSPFNRMIFNPSLRKFISTTPSQFYFYSNESTPAELTRYFHINKYAGCFRIIATAINRRPSRVDFFQNSSALIMIVDTQKNVIPPPSITSVTISQNGLQLNIQFSIPTNQPSFGSVSGFNCSLLLVFPGATVSSCIWSSAATVVATFSVQAANTIATPGDKLSLLPGYLIAACYAASLCSQFLPSKSIQTVFIGPPLIPIVPVVSLQSSSAIGPCNDMVLDPTASYGNGGRPWTIVQWKVVSYILSVDGTPTTLASGAAVETFLNLNYHHDSNMSRAVVVPNYLLKSQRQYSISLKLNNFLNNTSFRTASIFVQDRPAALNVYIVGSKELVVFPNNSLELYCVSAYPTRCNSSLTVPSKISYSWNVFLGINYISAIKSTSMDPRVFSLKPYSLSVGVVYTVQCKSSLVDMVTGKSLSGFYSDSVSVQVASTSTVQPIISNGVAIVSSVYADNVIDASASYDVDYSPSLSKRSVTFKWSCIQLIAIAYGEPCVGFNATSANLPRLWQTSFSLLPNTYLISVQVNSKFSTASGVASVKLTVLKDEIPMVQIVSLPSVVRYYSQVVVKGYVATTNLTALNWTLDSPSTGAYIGSLSSTPTSLFIRAGISQIFLPLNYGCLTAGVTYTFSLRAQFPYYNVRNSTTRPFSSASITFTVNQPPIGGILDVVPSSGYALQTNFILYTSKWVGNANTLPFKFSYYYSLQSKSTLYTIKTSSFLQSTSSLFPSGIYSNDRVLVVAVVATDVIGDTSNATTGVTVLPVQNAFTSLISTVKNLTALVLSGALPVEAAFQYSNAAVATVNAVDCSGVPISCSLLDRQECYDVPNTCGSCVNGYYGADGDANVPCIAAQYLSRNSRRGLSDEDNGVILRGFNNRLNSNSVGVPGDSCLSGYQCLSGSCSSTVEGSGVCIDAPKSCADDCNGQGQCMYYRNSVSVKSCSQNDDNCNAVCSCNLGYFGFDCSLNSSLVFLQRQQLRTSLCNSVSAIFAVNDVSMESIMLAVRSIGSIINVDTTQITAASLFTCSDLLFRIIDDHSDLLCSPDGFTVSSAAVLKVFSTLSAASKQLAIHQREVYFSTLLFYMARWVSLCRMYASVLGEPSKAAYLGTLAAISTLTNSNYYNSKNLDFPTARSTISQLTNAPAAAVVSYKDTSSSPGTSVRNCDNIGLSLFQFPFDPEGLSQNSHVLATAVYLDRYVFGCKETDFSYAPAAVSPNQAKPDRFPTMQPTHTYEKSTDVLITMNHFAKTTFGSLEAKKVYLYCNRSSVPVRVNGSCSQTFHETHQQLNKGITTIYSRSIKSNNVSLNCPINVVGYFTVTCPGYKISPTCTSFNGSAYVSAKFCSVVAFNAKNTTCRCTLHHDNSTLLSSTVYTVSGRFATTISQTYSGRYSVAYTELGKPRNREGSTIILAVSLSILVAYVLGVLLAAKVDKDSVTKKKKYETFSLAKPRNIDSFFNNIMPADFKFDHFDELVSSRLMKEHSILSMVTWQWGSSDIDFQRFLTRWLLFAGKLLTVCSMSTLDSFLFYRDDGSCETIKSSSSCNEKSGFSIFSTSVGSSCAWDYSSQSCSYDPPAWACTTVLVHVIFSTVAAASVYAVLSLLVNWLKRYEDISWDVTALEDKSNGFGDAHAHSDDYKFAAIHPTIDPTADELTNSLRSVNRYFIAARLKRIQGLSDFILPARECNAMLDAYTANSYKFELEGNRYGKVVTGYLDNKFTASYFRDLWATIAKYKVQGLVDTSRTVADRIDAHCNDLSSPYDMDSHLMKFFLVNLLNDHAKFISAKYMGITITGENRMKQLSKWGMYVDMVVVVLIILLLLILLLVCQSFIGTRSITMWVTVTLVAFFEDFCIVQPICILLNALEVDFNTREEFVRVWNTARVRYRYILNRRQGFMTYANSIVQHLNPGCRAARMKPELPVSRFLISINDFDFPVYSKSTKPASHTSNTIRSLLQWVFYLPKLTRILIFYCLSIIVINVLAMAVYLFGTQSLAGAVVIAIVILLIGLYVWPMAISRSVKESAQLLRRQLIATVKRLLGYISLEETFSSELRGSHRNRRNTMALSSQSPATAVKLPLRSESWKGAPAAQDDNGSLTRTLNELDTIIRNSSSHLSLESPYQFEKSRLSMDSSPVRIFGINTTEDYPFLSGTANGFSFDSSFGDFSKEESVEEKEELRKVIVRNDPSPRVRSPPTSVRQTINSSSDLRLSLPSRHTAEHILDESPTKSVRKTSVVRVQRRAIDSPSILAFDSTSALSSPSAPGMRASTSTLSLEGDVSPSKLQPKLRQTTVVQVQRRPVDSPASPPLTDVATVTQGVGETSPTKYQPLPIQFVQGNPMISAPLNDYSSVNAPPSSTSRSTRIRSSEDDVVVVHPSQRNARGSTRKGTSSVRAMSRGNSSAANDFDSVSTMDISTMKSTHAIPSTIESYLRQTDSDPRVIVLPADEGSYYEGDLTAISDGRNSGVNMKWSSPARANTAESKTPSTRLHQPLWVESLDDGSVSRLDMKPIRDGYDYNNNRSASLQSKPSKESIKLQNRLHDLSDENSLRSAAMRAKRRSHQIQGTSSRSLAFGSSTVASRDQSEVLLLLPVEQQGRSNQRLFQQSQLSNGSDNLPIDRSSSVSSYDIGSQSWIDPPRDEQRRNVRGGSRSERVPSGLEPGSVADGRKRFQEDERPRSDSNSNYNHNHNHNDRTRSVSRSRSRRAVRGVETNIDAADAAVAPADDRVPGPGSRRERRDK